MANSDNGYVYNSQMEFEQQPVPGNMPVDDLRISGRAKNALHKNGIWTVAEMLQVAQNPEEVQSWHGVGKAVSNDILSAAAQMTLVDEEEEGQNYAGDNVWHLVLLNRQLMEGVGELNIHHSDVPPRTFSRLITYKSDKLLDYLNVTPEQLSEIPNIGQLTAQQICDSLARRANKVFISSFDRPLKDDTILLKVVPDDGLSLQIRVDWDEFFETFWEDSGSLQEWIVSKRNDMKQEEGGPADAVCFYNAAGYSKMRRAAGKLDASFRAIGIELLPDSYQYFLARMLAIPGLDEKTIYEDGKRLLSKPIIDVLVDNTVVRDAMRKLIARELRQQEIGFTRKQVFDLIPDNIRAPEVLDSILSEMLEHKEIFKRDERYLLMYEHIADWINRYPDEKKRKILQLRLNGGTLQEVGTVVNLTRERVRQIVGNCLLEERFFEDHLAPVYKKYVFDDEQVRLAFGMIEGNYLSLSYSCGKIPLEEALDDSSLPLSIRYCVEKALDRDYIHDGRYLVKRQSNEVKNHIIRTQCHESTTVAEYIKKHEAFCKKYNLEPEKFSLDEQSIANKLHDSMITITTYGKKFRYYPIDTLDYTDLLEGLELKSYNDVEYSTQYFFVNYPQLMEQYDIRDFCELHNLLKKVIDTDVYTDISFGRMPVIRFGNPDREQQVRSMLMDYAPEIENMTLAKLYEERYGVSVPTFIANYTHCIRDYFFGGKYQLNVDQLPEENARKMREVLTEDFYVTDTLREIYKQTIPGATGMEIVPMTIRQIGFHPYQGYAVRADKYRTSTDFIEHLLMDNEEIYTSDFPAKLTIQHLFSRLYMVHKQNYDIFEIEPGHLVRLSYFEKKGIGKKDFDRYIDKAAKIQMDSEFFSIRSLRKAGLKDSLDKLHMSDWFYASLLQQRPEQFSLQRVGGTKIIRRGHSPFNAATVFEQVIREQGPMSPEQLVEFMRSEHGADVDKNRLLVMIPSSQLYYDRPNKMIYLDDENLEEMLANRRKEANIEDADQIS